MSHSFSALKRANSVSSISKGTNQSSPSRRTALLRERVNQKYKNQIEDSISPKRSKMIPIIRSKTNEQFWDQDGKLISQIETHLPSMQSKNDLPTHSSLCSRENKKYLQNKKIDPIWKRSNPDKQPNKSISSRGESLSSTRRSISTRSTRTSFQDFLNRQEKSTTHKNDAHQMNENFQTEPIHLRFIDKRSEEIAKNSIYKTKSKRKTEGKKQIAFKQDVPLTRDHKPKRSKSVEPKQKTKKIEFNDQENKNLNVTKTKTQKNEKRISAKTE